jgi:hypothetical protein
MASNKKSSSPQNMDSSAAEEERKSQVEVAAYFKSLARGFEPGHEIEDWVAAEMEQEV